MATARKRGRDIGRYRAEELPVRRWLQLGAASAGMGAAMLGWSLIGAQTGMASADSGVDASSASAGWAASSPNGVESRSASSSVSAASSSSRDDADPSASPRRTARTVTADSDDSDDRDDTDAPVGAVVRSERRSAPLSNPSAAQPSSVIERFTDSTAVRSRVASRATASPFDAALSAFTPKTAAAQPDQQPGAKVTWEFVYTEGAEYWTPERRRELEQSAAALGEYFDAPVPITITYEVVGDPGTENLADATSPSSSTDPGYHNTVVQEKFISGLDLNGPEYDGRIRFFFGNPFGLGHKIDDNDYDFVSTAMHEMVHSLGFGSDIYAPGTNTGTTWATYDRFIVDARGNHPIGPDYRFDNAFNPELVGWNGGMYFGGPNAVAAYGALIPLWTPDPFADGTSLSHLDGDVFTGANIQMMNSAANKLGNDRRTLSLMEQGIMADLGYQVNVQAPAPYAPPVAGFFVGFLFLRRMKRSQTTED